MRFMNTRPGRSSGTGHESNPMTHRTGSFILCVWVWIGIALYAGETRAMTWVNQGQGNSYMFLSQNAYYDVQNFWMTNNQLQINLGIGHQWSLTLKPSVLFITNNAMDSLWQGTLVTGFTWAGASSPGESLRYNVFFVGAGYQYAKAQGKENQFVQRKHGLASELYAELWATRWLDLSFNASFTVSRQNVDTEDAAQTVIAPITKTKIAVLLSGEKLHPYYLFAGLAGQTEHERDDIDWRRAEYKAGGFVTFRANLAAAVLMITVAGGYDVEEDNYALTKVRRTGPGVELEFLLGFF